MKKYTRSIIAYIDILGFGSLVESKSCNTIYSVLEKFVGKAKFFDEHTSLAFSLNEKDYVKFKPHQKLERLLFFSDTIVWCYPLLFEEKSTGYKIAIANALSLFQMIQSNLFSNGIPIRGGITVGEILIEGNKFFGPGLIQAYKLCEKKAKYPRIIVDPNITSDLKALPLYMANLDADGRYKSISHFKDSYHLFCRMDPKFSLGLKELHFKRLLSYRALILKGLGSSSSRVYLKYRWLQKKYNVVISKIHSSKSSILTKAEQKKLII